MNPILAHIHVPKCAGTSVRHTFDRVFGPAHVNLYFPQTTFVIETSDLAAWVSPSQVRAFSSHHVRTFPAELSGRPVHYITFLRQPIEQFLSYVTFVRRVYDEISDPILRCQIPPDMPNMSIRDSARWLLSTPSDVYRNFSENYATNYFARYVVLEQKGYNYASPYYRGIRLDTAKQALESFLFVGLCEQMSESWELLSKRCESAGIGISAPPPPRENVCPREAGDYSWVHDDDEVGHMLLTAVQDDLALYATAQNLFHSYQESPKKSLVAATL